MTSTTPYQKANTDWFADCKVGLSTHWTAQTVPKEGKACEFVDAVNRFRMDEFLNAVETSGVDYVIFTLTHALQMLPCPHPVIDSILPGRTTERDLIGEMAQGLDRLGKKLILYYNHSCNHGEDPLWEQAVGYHDQPKERLEDNLCEIVAWMGEKYGELIKAWWFDSSYSLDPRGTRDTVTTDMKGFQFSWERLNIAAKSGYKQRLVTFNAGVAQTFLYSDHQDYWSGELMNLDTPPSSRYLESGLQWHGWTCLDDRAWVYSDNKIPPHPPIYTDTEIIEFIAKCREHRAPMTFNVISFQDGTMSEKSINQLQKLTYKIRL